MNRKCLERFSKYILLLIGLFLIVVATYFGIAFVRMRAAVKHIELKGGYVEFLHHEPNWLAHLMGDSYPFKTVEIVQFGFHSSDDDLSVLQDLKQTRVVFLNAMDVKGTGLANLKKLPRLQTLELTKSSLTDESMEYLGNLQGLHNLGLAMTKIGDPGIAHLIHLTNLEELDLQGTKVTDLSLHYLSVVPLKYLDVRGTSVTSEGIAFITKSNPAVHIVQ